MSRGRTTTGTSGPSTSRQRVDAEIDELCPALDGGNYLGFVHGDLCPDNVRVMDGGCRIFDFERFGRGSVALDAACLLAPFSSCWCFSRPPDELADLALDAYRAGLAASGIGLGDDWGAAVTDALAAWVVARGGVIARALEEDRQWGTTTMRPRLIAWTESFAAAAISAGVFPWLRLLAEGLHDRLRSTWPDMVTPEYPAFAGPASARAKLPGWWHPGLEAGSHRASEEECP